MSVTRLVLTLSFLVGFIASVHGASVLDLIDWDDAKKLIEVPELRDDQSNRNCLCKGPACICCVDFNITFVDLGGPGCVHMRYLSPEEGFSVNVSYGKNLIHKAKIQGANPAPICLEVFGRFAQICAKFTDLAPTSDGLRGCLELEPKLLGEGQLDFPIGCFKSTAGGMEMEDPPEVEQTTETSTNGTEEEDGFDAEGFLLGVYQTAEQGVAFLSSLLDLPNRLNGTRPGVGKPEVTTVKAETVSQINAQRSPKSLKHPNKL